MSLKQITDLQIGKKAKETMGLLDASASEADKALEDVENEIDSRSVKLNEATKEHANTGIQILVILNIVLFFIAILLALGMSNMITKPLEKLSDASEQLGSGNVDVKIPDIKSKDEIEELAKCMITVSEAIKFLKKSKK